MTILTLTTFVPAIAAAFEKTRDISYIIGFLVVFGPGLIKLWLGDK